MAEVCPHCLEKELADEVAAEPCPCGEDCNGCWTPFNEDGSLRDLESEGWTRVGCLEEKRAQVLLIRDYASDDLSWTENVHDFVVADED